MTTEITEATTNPISGQLPAIKVLAGLIEQHPHLPAAYVIVHEPFGDRVQLNLQVAGSEFEVWREALGIRPEDVVLHFTPSHTWVAADNYRREIRVHLSGFTDPLTLDQANAPREIEGATA